MLIGQIFLQRSSTGVTWPQKMPLPQESTEFPKKKAAIAIFVIILTIAAIVGGVALVRGRSNTKTKDQTAATREQATKDASGSNGKKGESDIVLNTTVTNSAADTSIAANTAIAANTNTDAHKADKTVPSPSTAIKPRERKVTNERLRDPKVKDAAGSAELNKSPLPEGSASGASSAPGTVPIKDSSDADKTGTDGSSDVKSTLPKKTASKADVDEKAKPEVTVEKPGEQKPENKTAKAEDEKKPSEDQKKPFELKPEDQKKPSEPKPEDQKKPSELKPEDEKKKREDEESSTDDEKENETDQELGKKEESEQDEKEQKLEVVKPIGDKSNPNLDGDGDEDEDDIFAPSNSKDRKPTDDVDIFATSKTSNSRSPTDDVDIFAPSTDVDDARASSKTKNSDTDDEDDIFTSLNSDYVPNGNLNDLFASLISNSKESIDDVDDLFTSSNSNIKKQIDDLFDSSNDDDLDDLLA